MDTGFKSLTPYKSCRMPERAPIIDPKPEFDPSGLWGIDGSIVLYGIIADILLIVPLVMYLVIADAANNDMRKYHQTYINMLYSAYAPLGISWWIVLADDSQIARTTVTAAVE
jgi:hypothetical protein